MTVDKKKFFQGDKNKLIFENLIFPQRDFVFRWKLHVNMADYFIPFMPSSNKKPYILEQTCSFLDAGLFKYI